MFGLREVFEPPQSQVDQSRVRRWRVAQSIRERSGEEHLTAVSDRHQPRNAVDRRSEIIRVAFLGIAGMQAHTHAQAVDTGEVFVGKGPLRVDRGGYRIRRGMEGGAKLVAHQLEDVPTVADDRAAHDLLVAYDRGPHRRGMCFPALGRSLDIRKEKRHLTSR